MKTATLILATSAIIASPAVAFAPCNAPQSFTKLHHSPATATTVDTDCNMANDEDLFMKSSVQTFDYLQDAYSSLPGLWSGSSAGEESMMVQLEQQEADLLARLQDTAESDDFFFPKPNEDASDAMRDAMKEATKTMKITFESDGLMMVESSRRRRGS